MNRQKFLALRELIEARTGLHFDEEQALSLELALRERMPAAHCLTVQGYLRRLTADADEFDRLVNSLTVGETAFFRYEAHFQALSRRVLPELLQKRRSTRRLRIWSAGCATGQETYSLAIAALEAMDDPATWDLGVLGVDINRDFLDLARRGAYKPKQVENLEARLLHKYFRKEGDRFVVRPFLRDRVRFAYFNLAEPSGWEQLDIFDIIFCQNVTIYFNPETTEKVVERLARVLADDGYLFLGYSETLWQRSDEFEPVDLGGAFAYRRAIRRRRAPAQAHPTAAPSPAPRRRGRQPVLSTPQPRMLVPRSTAVTQPRATSSADDVPRPHAPPPNGSRASSEAILAQAQRLHAEAGPDAALEHLQPLLAGDLEDDHGHLLAARIAADRGQDEDALRHCRKAIRLDPLLDEAHFLLGVLHLRRGDSEAAIQALRRAIYLQNDDPLAHFHLASALRLKGDMEGAARAYRNAARLLRERPPDEQLGELSVGLLLAACERARQSLSSE